MRRHPIRVVSLLLAAGVCTAPARAHLMPPQQATLNIRDSAAFGVFSIPVSALQGWDDDRNGRMSPDELARHRPVVLRQLSAGIRIDRVRDGQLDAGRLDLMLPSLDVDPSIAPGRAQATHLLVLVRQSFTRGPEALRLTFTLFGRSATDGELLVKATVDGARPEVAILRRGDVRHEFFAPPSLFVRVVVQPALAWIRRVAS